jgi:hypothetical protein
VELLTGELNLLLQESGWEYVLCPNIFETFSHVINAVMDAIEGVRVALGPTDQLSYCLQGPLHPVRTGREVYWKIYNSLYIGSHDGLVAAYPVLQPDLSCHRPTRILSEYEGSRVPLPLVALT